jgi:cell division protein FtsA
MFQRHIFALDIGTSAIKGAVWRPANRKGASGSITAFAEHPVETGMQRGVIRDPEEIANRTAHLVEELERISGEKISHGLIGVGGAHLESRSAKGSVVVSRPDRTVSSEDIERALEISRSMAFLPNRDTLHIIPRSYGLDGVGGIVNPLEMQGYHLDAETFIIDGFLPALSSLDKTLELANIRADRKVALPLAGARAALTRRDREEGVIAIDIGGSTTSLAVFEEDNLAHVAVLKQGGHDITQDIGKALKLPLDAAETLKLETGSATTQNIDKKETIMLSRHFEGADERISKRYIAEIIEAKAEEIFDLVAQELKKIDRFGNLAAGAVIFGGGARLRGIEVLAKKSLKMTSRFATPSHLLQHFSETPGLQFYNVCGLILWALDEAGGEGTGSLLAGAGRIRGSWKKIKDFLKIFLP